MEVSLDEIPEKDLVKILFSENPGILIQVEKIDEVEKILKKAGVAFIRLARPCDERHLLIHKDGADYQFFIDHLRDVWFESSYLLDRKQSGEKAAKDRFLNYKEQPLQFRFPDSFTGTLAQYGISADRRTRSGVKASHHS